MALPTQLINAIDSLHDQTNGIDNTSVFMRLTMANKLWKLRLKKQTINGKVQFIVDISER
jgi:hypothetical protein